MNIEQAQALAMICHYAKEYLKDNKTMSQSVDIAKGIIKKEIKALKIVKKLFDIKVVLIYPSGDYELDIYNKNSLILYTYAKLTKEEYDLLKEVLSHEE